METLSLFSDLDDVGFAEQRDAVTGWAIDRIDDIAMARRAGELVPGLDYMPGIISPDEEQQLLRWIDAMPWSSHWQRRTQFYGRRYLPSDVEARAQNETQARLDESFAAEHLPWWSMWLRERLVNLEVFDRLPNQMGINEYLPGQGIAPHVDYESGTVVSITLSTGCVMDFTEIDGPGSASTWLAPRSMVIMKGAARHLWKHGISRRKRDIVGGMPIQRGRRVSVTFRYILPGT